MRHRYFNDTECLLHQIMHMYFNNKTEHYLLYAVLLCEWSQENILRIVNSGFPPAITYEYQ